MLSLGFYAAQRARPNTPAVPLRLAAKQLKIRRCGGFMTGQRTSPQAKWSGHLTLDRGGVQIKFLSHKGRENRTYPKLSSSFLKHGVNSCLGDVLVDVRFRTAGRDRSDGLAVYLDRQASLAGKEIRKREDVEIAFLESVRAVF